MIDRILTAMFGKTPTAPAAPKMGYDSLAPDQARKRRQPSVEMAPESGRIAVMTDWDMLRATANSRNLYRNYMQAKSLLIQFKLHVIGTGNTMFCTTDDESWNETTTEWYNRTWAASCDARDDRHLHDLNAMVLGSVLREHDCVGFFDSAGISGDSAGKLWFWETDQIANLSQVDWKKHSGEIAARLGIDANGIIQESGVVSDRWGRVSGYIAHSGRGVTECRWEDATVLPRGPARLFKNTWRLNDHRGKSELLTAAASLVDAYEILQAELQGAKGAAKWVAAIKTDDSHFKSIGRTDRGDSTGRIEIDNDDVEEMSTYRQLEQMLDGQLEYMDPGDELDLKANPRLGGNLETWLMHQAVMAGASMGLPRFYSVLKADASFSATRAEMNLGDSLFSTWHMWMERYPLSWEAEYGIAYGIASGQIQAPSVPWVGRYEWDHPKTPPIQELQQASAREKQYLSGEKTLRDVVGPDWRDQLRQRDREITFRQGLKSAATTQTGAGK